MAIKRYQIKIVDGDLTDMVHEISTGIVTSIAANFKNEIRNLALYPHIFESCKRTLKRYVRGFHVCGCRSHCDANSVPTELRSAAAQKLESVPYWSPRVSRYVLFLEVTLKQFAKEMEVNILRAAAENAEVRNWHGKLLPLIREVVEPTLGKYVFFSPDCNRGQYICEVGACTEFDPWEKIKPKEGKVL